MRIRVSGQAPGSYKGDLLAIGCFEGARWDDGILRDLDQVSQGWVRRLLGGGEFLGKEGEVLLQKTLGALAASKLMLVGMGKREKFNLEGWRGLASRVAQKARDLRVKEFALAIRSVPGVELDTSLLAASSVEGALLGLYRFKGFKNDTDETKDPQEMLILVPGRAGGRLDAAVKEAEVVCQAVLWVRDLVATPANKLTPKLLAERAVEMARSTGLVARVLDEVEIRSMGMGGILAIASGSSEPPRVIVVEHGKNLRGAPTVALVGKGITFDSGGINLKPSEKMDQMKDDMAGGAAVLGTLMAAAKLGLPAHLVGIVPATENLPSGSACKPGDVVRTMSGKTIEIANTDAEGRVILADGITYALRYKPSLIIDLATLTGACVVALGSSVAGMMGNDEKLMEELKKAGEITGEEVWPLPLKEEYEDLIKSDVADVKNSGGREAGAIQGGLFLKKFVGNTPWVHIDIAGPVWTDKDKPYRPKGPTGFGVRLLVRFLVDHLKAKRV